jgi:hypothetical protein
VAGAVKQVNNLKGAENGPFAAAEIVGLCTPERGWIAAVAGCEAGPPAEGEHDPDLCGRYGDGVGSWLHDDTNSHEGQHDDDAP